MNLDAFTRQYIETALWSTNDESTPGGGVPLDANYNVVGIHPATLETMIQDCAKFQEQNADDIGDRSGDAGHDFWLTRHHLGCGFWETPDWPEEVGQRLTKAAQSFPEQNLYVGDDGLIYHS